MQAVGLSTYIWNNNLRSLLLLAGFPVLLIGMVWGLDFAFQAADAIDSGRNIGRAFGNATEDLIFSIPGALVTAGIWFVIAYFFNGIIVDLATGSRTVSREDQPRLYNLLENLCISRGLPMPQVKIMQSEELNAFASGLHPGRFSVSVTQGILDRLEDDELEAVLAHELTHIMNRDVRTMVVASVFAGIISLIAQMIFRGFLRFGIGRGGGRGRSGGGALVFVVIAFAVAAVGYVLAIVIRMAISRSREFVADAGSAELTKNPDAMIRALRKVSGHAHLEAPESMRAMFLANDEAGVYSLFATHPPVEQRIAALVAYAGGHDLALPSMEPSSAPETAPPPVPEETPAADPTTPPAGPWS
ncbi:MAG: M48 family metallopeptidase [Caulobacteraceae bacterium]